MIGHQRDILATLGIEVWIPRDSACQPHQVSIWRDQAAPEFHTDIVLPQPAQMDRLAELPLPESQPVPVVELRPKAAPAASLVEQVPVQELRELVQIPPFSLQALSLAHCSIVVDTTAITEEQQSLWNNIQRAVLGEFYELNWPFPWADVQDGRGVESYIQGFVDGISAEKNIIFLGPILHISATKSIQLASLQEMLDQPIRKKRLWQFLQNKPRSLE